MITPLFMSRSITHLVLELIMAHLVNNNKCFFLLLFFFY
jgi:hypothetical protein